LSSFRTTSPPLSRIAVAMPLPISPPARVREGHGKFPEKNALQRAVNVTSNDAVLCELAWLEPAVRHPYFNQRHRYSQLYRYRSRDRYRQHRQRDAPGTLVQARRAKNM
jgi:hypothetical protein